MSGFAHYVCHSRVYRVTLEARHRLGATALLTTAVNVPGGYASGKHTLIFRDVLPWQNISIENLLFAAGFTQGPRTNHFEIVQSTSMNTRALVPGETFVIVGNSQNRRFYDRNAANNVKFATFVYNGGTMFWEACDSGSSVKVLPREALLPATHKLHRPLDV